MMHEQLPMTFGAIAAGTEDWNAQLQWLRRAVDVLGHKFVAGELDIAPSNLTDALLERERKEMKGRWIAAIVRLVSPSMREEWLTISCEPHGYDAKRRPTMTPEQELALLREHMRADAPGALSRFDTSLGRAPVSLVEAARR